MHPKFWWENLKERDHSEECVDRKILLKLTLKE
jgi:hypothetical protein